NGIRCCRRGRFPARFRRRGAMGVVILANSVSQETGSDFPAHELERWKRIFLEQGTRGLKTRSDPEERELTLARAKIGELMMRLELAEHLIKKRGLTDEWKKQLR